jgi:anti-anti-sigma factor
MGELIHERLAWAEVLRACGEFDLASASDLESAIAGALRTTLPLILDLAACQYIDSTILRVLVHAVREAPGRVGIIVPPDARIRRIFEMTGLHVLLPIAGSALELQARMVA